MEMHQIRYFLAVSRILNFTRAADTCNVTQPALTRAIKQLEAELGGELFRRERGFTHLTELGKRLLPVLQRCYDSAIEVKSSAESFAKSGGAGLEIAISDGINLDLLAPLLGDVARLFPLVDINLRRGSSTDALAWLKKGDVEFALAGDLDDRWARIDRWPLASEHYSLVVSSLHPLQNARGATPSMLVGERLLAIPSCRHADAIVAELGSHAISRRDVGNIADIVSLVGVNCGVAVLPDRVALPTHLCRIEISGLAASSEVAVYAVAGRRRSKAAQHLIKCLRLSTEDAATTHAAQAEASFTLAG